MPNSDGKTLVGGIILHDSEGLWKLLIGAPDRFYLIDQDVLTGPSWPNSSSHLEPDLKARTCGREAERGCLFNLLTDPYESNSVATQETDRFDRMLARVDELQTTVYSPERGTKDPQACQVAKGRGGYWGPWIGG